MADVAVSVPGSPRAQAAQKVEMVKGQQAQDQSQARARQLNPA